MPDATQCREILSRYLRARIPLVVVRTAEPKRAMALLRSVAEEMQTAFVSHGLSTGLRDLRTDRPLGDDRSLVGALEEAARQFLSRQTVTFVLTDAQELGNDTATARQLKDIVTIGIDRGGSVVVVTDDAVWPDLQALGMAVVLDPPSVDEMLQIVRDSIEPYRPHVTVEWSADEFALAARLLAGITQVQAENICAAIIAGGAVRCEDIAELSRLKDGAFADLSGLERVAVRTDELAVGGLEALKAWLARKRPLLTADLSGRDIRPPRGVLLVGVPGCGKSLSAKAISVSWELPLYRLDMPSIFGQYVGQSETRFREALERADSAAPCILWIDEIEKGLAGGGTDSTGVTTRLIGQFLYWLQESPHRVFVIATANDVTMLPPELLRRGRFDEIFSVDLPETSERREIIGLYLRRRLVQAVPDALLDELAELSDGFAGADLEAACREVAEHALLSGEDIVDADLIRLCFTNIVPLSRTNPERIEAIREWGRERAVPASHAASTHGTGLRVVIEPRKEAR